MKPSKYNFYHTQNDRFFIYNQLTGFLSEFDEEMFLAIREGSLPADIPAGQMQELERNHFVCKEELQEELVMLRRNRETRYGNHIARVTVMPTLDCNFRCWYCYEEHLPSRMDDTVRDATISFCKKLIDRYRLREFSLDWFGGEPLLYFDEVMYPVAAAVRDYCGEHKVAFRHAITTNGYLIDEERIEKFKELRLRQFQITLDGSEKFHNRTRFSDSDRSTYKTIVANITRLVRSIDPIDMSLRINYTPANLPTMEEIADSFPEDVRGRIQILPQIVWQYKEVVNTINDTVHDKLKVFSDKDYSAERVYLHPSNGTGCYTENMLQFVINYDAKVFKCTARNFHDGGTSIGEIDADGELVINPYYYKYFTSSAFENEQCLACGYLPSCTGMCIQKKIDNGLPKCPREEIRETLTNQLRLVINKQTGNHKANR